MDHHTLLLLGLLRNQKQHGYQINDFIERALSSITTLKKPTAYALLDRLYKQGLVDVQNEQEGNRPPRKVYALTPGGLEHFLKLLRETLSEATPPDLPDHIALMFLDQLEPNERLECLIRRLAKLEDHIATLEAVPSHDDIGSVGLAIERQLMLLNADRAWLEALIERQPPIGSNRDGSNPKRGRHL
jgi:DNA-binding PadR family transcriptional regulator